MALLQDRYYVGQGEAALYLRTAAGKRTDGRLIGNCTSIEIQVDAQETKHVESRTGQRLTDDKIIWGYTAAISVTFESISKENLAFIFNGSSSVVASGTVTDEPQAFGKIIQLDHNGVDPTTVVLKKGSTVINANRYRVLPSGLVEFVDPATDSLASGDTILATYTHAAYEQVAAFTQPSQEFWFSTHAINKSQKAIGKENPVTLDCYRVKFMPKSKWSLIGTDYANFSIDGELLLDPYQSASGVGGQFFSEKQLTLP